MARISPLAVSVSTAVAMALTAIGIDAQASHQPFGLWAGASDATSRGSLGAGPGETLQGFHASHHRGLFEFQGVAEITALRTVVQDEDGSTQESFGWVVRRGTDTGGPQVGDGGVIGSVDGLGTPPPQGPGPVAHTMATILQQPIRLPTPVGHLALGLRLGPAPRWDRDGLSTHMSSFLAQHSHLRQEDHAWDLVEGTTAPTHPTLLRSWRYEAFTFFGTMRLGCGGRFGMGGMFPRPSTAAVPFSLAAFFRGGTACAGGTPMVALALIRTAGVDYGQTGRLYLAGPMIVLTGPPTNLNGTGLVPIAPFLPVSASGQGTVHLQGAIRLPNGATKLTNAQSVTL